MNRFKQKLSFLNLIVYVLFKNLNISPLTPTVNRGFNFGRQKRREGSKIEYSVVS